MSMSIAIEKTLLSLNRFISRHQAKSYRYKYRVVYRDHCDLRVIRRKVPNDNRFTTQHTTVQDFLSFGKVGDGGFRI